MAGVRVLDFSRIIAGPLCAQYLADLGADVIKVERPGSGDEARSYVFPATWDGVSTMFLSFNRGKRSVELDLSTDDGRAQVLELVSSADVLVENFRPDVMARLGLGYDALSRDNPRLVYCSISGFGSEGPLAMAGANDLVAQASCGLMSINASADGRPTKVAPAVVDLFTAVNAALAILAALRQRDAVGRGTHVTTSLFECGVSMLSYFATSSIAERFAARPPEFSQAASASITVPNQAFRCADGWIVVACANEPMWLRLTQALGRRELGEDPRFSSNLARTRHKDELIRILDELFLQQRCEDCLARLADAKVSASAALSVAQVLDHPQTASLGMITAADHATISRFRMLAAPFRIGGSRHASPLAPPAPGEHNLAVLSRLARTDEVDGAAHLGTDGQEAS